MLDIKYLAQNTKEANKRLATRNGDYNIDGAVVLDNKRKELLQEVEALKARRNQASAKIAQLMRSKEAKDKAEADKLKDEVKREGDKLKDLDGKLSEIETKLKDFLLSIPNIPHESVPIGKDETVNKEIRKKGKLPKFDFEPKAHWEIGEKAGVLDFATGAKVAGARFTVYKGWGAKLERALINLMLDTHGKAGYTEVLPPFMINRDSMTGTGQLPKFEEDAFLVANNGYFLAPTAEVPVTNIHRDEIIKADTLPISYTAYTPCFRAEAGSAGRDTRGLIRQHQFNKVELVKFATPESSSALLEQLTGDAEKILQLLELPYRVVLLCTGDMGFASQKTYDIEVWMPSYGKYVEISSCSNFGDFQARRANIRYRNAEGKNNFVHTLNGSGLALGRTVAAIIENYQQKDGSVAVPKVLKSYFGDKFV
ncbi:MAG: serine--tRNA ligase [Firmicutes bacterium]|nr:serine--tRNA ligase [Bacillota bacterium]